MSSAICTLFEGHYHFGLAGLTNSLYFQGFRGSIYAGYRGSLPRWASAAKEDISIPWNGSRTFQVAEGLQLHFLPIETDYHFSNYKPDFMLRLWDGPAEGVQNMFYFDPDIITVCSWQVFEEWASCGVALTEDVNSPLAKFHPRRVTWRRYFGEKGISLNFKDSIYVNSGFVGVNLENKNFLEHWKKMQETMAPLIGGLGMSIFKLDHVAMLEQVGGPFMPFVKTDQDALNATIEACDHKISFIGKEGMGFENGFILMYHALGHPKPWRWKPLKQSMDGKPPRNVDIEFWNSASGPVITIPAKVIQRVKFYMKIAKAVGRFYKRN